jgi:5-methylcytosine-specific restriction endonuclease McrA
MQDPTTAEPVVIHGTNTRYARGCRCEPCRAAASTYQKDHYRRNADRKRAAARARYAAKREEIKAAQRARNAANREGKAEASRQWYEANRERALDLARAWAKANPDARNAARARRRFSLTTNDLRLVTARDWARLCVRYGNRCAYCKASGPLTQDHIVPVVRGGRHAIGNLLPACASCNSRKRHRLIVEWRHAEARAAA